MAANFGIVQTAEIALVAATAKTVVQLIAPATVRLRVLGWSVSFDGVSAAAEPVQCRLLRQTTAIGGTPTANNPVKLDNSIGDALQATGAIYGGSPTEPTAGDVLDVMEVHPQGGYEVIFPQGQEPIVAFSGRLGIECTAPANVNVRAKLKYEE